MGERRERETLDFALCERYQCVVVIFAMWYITTYQIPVSYSLSLINTKMKFRADEYKSSHLCTVHAGMIPELLRGYYGRERQQALCARFFEHRCGKSKKKKKRKTRPHTRRGGMCLYITTAYPSPNGGHKCIILDIYVTGMHRVLGEFVR